MKELISTTESYIIRSKTNGGEFCKQRFHLIKSGDEVDNIVLCIYKLVLVESDRFDAYEKSNFTNLKSFRNKRLYYQVFNIKLDTLEEVINWLINLK